MASRIADLAFDCGDCEYNSLFGASGECVDNQTRCECPEGFTGVDDWLVYEDCHVNIALAEGVNAVLLALKAIGFIICFLAVIHLSRKWDLTVFSAVPRPKPKQPVSPRDDSKSRLKALRINTLRVNLFLAMFTFVGVGYNGLFLVQPESEEDRMTLRDSFPFHALCLTFSYTGILGALFLMLKTWYDTLPDVRAYGKLFKVDPFFVKYPNLVPNLCKAMIWGSLLGPLGIIVVFPAFDDSNYPLFALLLVILSLVYLGLFGLLQFVVITSVMKLYKDILTREKDRTQPLGTSARADNSTKLFAKAYQTAVLMRKFCTALAIFCVIIGVFFLAVEVSHQYLIFNFVSLGPCVIAIFFPPVSILKTNGGLAPYQSNTGNTPSRNKGTHNQSASNMKLEESINSSRL